jgi:hypothetical protein
MSTSGTYTFTVTRDDIIREAMLNIGKLGSTDTIQPQETLDCARKLNMMVKQWMGRNDFAPGLKMWTRYRGDLFLSQTRGVYTLSPTGDNWAAGVAIVLNPNTPNYNQAQLTAAVAANATTLAIGTTAIAGLTIGDFIVVQLSSGDIYSTTVSTINVGAGTFTIPATGLPSAAAANNYLWNYTTKGQTPLEISTCLLRDTNYVDTPIDYMTVETYEALPSKLQPGFVSDPTSIYYEPQLVSGVRSGQLWVDCAGAQDVTKRLHIVCLRPIQDFNNPLDTPEYPQEWYDALCWGLSKRICPMFNAPWTKEMEDNHASAIAMARESNPERTEFYFQPNAGSPYQP